MTIGLLFWIIMLVWLVFGLWSNWPATKPGNRIRPLGGTVLLFVLLLLLGWGIFGAPIKG